MNRFDIQRQQQRSQVAGKAVDAALGNQGRHNAREPRAQKIARPTESC